MEVILRQDIDKLGNRGDIVKVANGYGRNYLLPRGMAVRISAGSLKQIEHERRFLEVARRKELASAEELRARIESLELTFKRRVGDSETLYGSVTNADIADGLEAEGVTLDRRKIVLDEPIKSLGNYTVLAKLHSDVQAKVKLYVVQDD